MSESLENQAHPRSADSTVAPHDGLSIGQRVTVTQQVQHKGWTASVTGVINALEQRKTGSWFAHAKDDKLWLDRLVLQKDDGEIVVCNLDRYTRVEVVTEESDTPDDDQEDRVGDLSAGATHAGVGSHPTGAAVDGIETAAQRRGLQPDTMDSLEDSPERADADG